MESEGLTPSVPLNMTLAICIHWFTLFNGRISHARIS